jgi:hypothetical protein
MAGGGGGGRLRRVPRIDWVDDNNNDNLPRWEPRPRRERASREIRDRRARLEQIIAMAAGPPALPEPPVRRPLHLIWGRPIPDQRPRAAPDSGGEPDQRPG